MKNKKMTAQERTAAQLVYRALGGQGNPFSNQVQRWEATIDHHTVESILRAHLGGHRPRSNEELFKAFGHNRPIKDAKCKEYGIAMKEGKWSPYTMPVHLDIFGRLLNGRHRFLGCMAHKTSFKTMIYWNITQFDADRMDIGATRTTFDVITMNNPERSISTNHASVLSFCLREAFPELDGNLPPYEVDEVYQAFADELDYAILKTQDFGHGLSNAGVKAAFFLSYIYDPEAYTDAISNVRQGLRLARKNSDQAFGAGMCMFNAYSREKIRQSDERQKDVDRAEKDIREGKLMPNGGRQLSRFGYRLGRYALDHQVSLGKPGRTKSRTYSIEEIQGYVPRFAQDPMIESFRKACVDAGLAIAHHEVTNINVNTFDTGMVETNPPELYAAG